MPSTIHWPSPYCTQWTFRPSSNHWTSPIRKMEQIEFFFSDWGIVENKFQKRGMWGKKSQYCVPKFHIGTFYKNNYYFHFLKPVLILLEYNEIINYCSEHLFVLIINNESANKRSLFLGMNTSS